MIREYEDNVKEPSLQFSDKPLKGVEKMVREYEDNIIEPPVGFRDDFKPVPA